MVTASPVVLLHVATAVPSLILGGWQLLARPKGSASHRMIGRVWVGLMAVTAISAFWITTIDPGHWSLLHLLSGLTLSGIVAGLRAARQGRIAAHRRAVIMTYIGLWGAFIGAVLVPGRLLSVY